METAVVAIHRMAPRPMMMAWQGVDGRADGEGVHRGAQAAAAGAQKHGGRADERVEAGGHHGGGEQGVERDGLLAHAVGGAADGEDDHEHDDDGELVALELLHEHGDARVERAGLGHHAEESAEDHHEQAYGKRIGEALDGRGEEVAELGCAHLAGGEAGYDDGDDGDDGQQQEKNGE